MAETQPNESFIKQFEALKSVDTTKNQFQDNDSMKMQYFKKKVEKLRAKIDGQIEQLKKQKEQKNEEQKEISDSNRDTKEQ